MFYRIDQPLPDDKATKEYLGGKGWGLYWMRQQGINVPPAVIFPTTACTLYMKDPKAATELIKEQIPAIRAYFSEQFGYMPLLSVRSGARVSMPGMMDTILNVGIDPNTEALWRGKLGDQCFEDCRKRLLVMFGDVVKGLNRKNLEQQASGSYDAARGYYYSSTKEAFPMAADQLLESILAVFRSWNNDRAKTYRKLNNIPEDWGTAVVVQAMVFGNLNDQSATGVLFTRNPDTGANGVVGEFLINGQGEDVVAGLRTPSPLKDMQGWNIDVAQELLDTAEKLEKLKGDVQDIEFTVQDGKLYILQTRDAKRTAQAAVKIAVDMYLDALIDFPTVLKRVDAKTLDKAQQPILAPGFNTPEFAKGIPACSGIVSGRPVFSSKEAEVATDAVILITEETCPDDIAGMHKAVGVLTMTGGSTSHAAVVARGMDKPCVCGLGLPLAKFMGTSRVSIDGATGRVWLGDVPILAGKSEAVEAFYLLLRGNHDYIPMVKEAPALSLPACAFYLGDFGCDLDALTTAVAGALNNAGRVFIDLNLTALESNFYSDIIDLDVLVESAQDKLRALEGADRLYFFGGKGSNVIPTLDSLEDLILAEGAIAVHPGFKPSKAVEKVLQWKKTENVSLVSLGSELKGAQPILSDAQKLASL